jgi:hypothetical protein
MVIAACVQAASALVLVGITAYYASVTHNLLKSQVNPLVDFEVPAGTAEVVISNSGAYQVLDVSVNADSVSFLGPPWNKPAMRVTRGRRIPGRTPGDWWRLEKLDPGEVQKRSISDVVDNALSGTDWMEKARKEGHLSGIPVHDKAQFFTFLVFRLTFHRDFDHKRHAMQRMVYVGRDVTGKPHAWDVEDFAMPLLQDVVRKLREELDHGKTTDSSK